MSFLFYLATTSNAGYFPSRSGRVVRPSHDAWVSPRLSAVEKPFTASPYLNVIFVVTNRNKLKKSSAVAVAAGIHTARQVAAMAVA